MPTYRYWSLDDKESPDYDPTVVAIDEQEAAETAVEEMINDGDTDLTRHNAIQLAVRMIKPERSESAQMFEVFVDWAPSCIAHARGELPES